MQRDMFTTRAVLVAAAWALPFAAAAAQETTKPRAPTPVPRLYAPARISASQQADGRIRVVWSAVRGAEKYALSRSVANIGRAAVTLPNPKDTVYLDSDVKKGDYYYYIVNAVNESGITGMNVSAPPVAATISATTGATTTPTTTDTTPTPQRPDTTSSNTDTTTPQSASDGTTAPTVTVAPPRNVRVPFFYPNPRVFWDSSQAGVRYLVDRAEVSSAGPPTWRPVPWANYKNPCCVVTDYLRDIPGGTRLVYRVTAVDTASQTMSTPVLSNEVTTAEFKILPPAIGRALEVYVTSDLQPYDVRKVADLHLTNVRWVSLNQSVVTVDSQAYSVCPMPSCMLGLKMRGLAPGEGYIVATGLTSNGEVQPVVYKAYVIPRP